jgi:hypothetical protein
MPGLLSSARSSRQPPTTTARAPWKSTACES